jgi:curved DNA-binding protein CbpA
VTENPYSVLGLTPHASMIDIKRAYFGRVRMHPPETDPEGFQRIRAAYEALRTPASRAVTDRQLIQPPPPFSLARRLPPLDLDFHPADRWAEARGASDLDRTDFSDDFRPVPDPGDFTDSDEVAP